MTSQLLQRLGSIPREEEGQKRNSGFLAQSENHSRLDGQYRTHAKGLLAGPGLAELVTHDDVHASVGTFGRREETKKQKGTRLREKKRERTADSISVSSRRQAANKKS